jgi:copper chaperone CopZ
VGKTALEGLEGIQQVDRGFHNFKEINTVHYDASTVTIEEMENALRKAGTYQGTVK